MSIEAYNRNGKRNTYGYSRLLVVLVYMWRNAYVQWFSGCKNEKYRICCCLCNLKHFISRITHTPYYSTKWFCNLRVCFEHFTNDKTRCLWCQPAILRHLRRRKERVKRVRLVHSCYGRQRHRSHRMDCRMAAVWRRRGNNSAKN